ncbi:hypothetical protein PCE1_003706 [Barthelona sp. PCE]
MQNAGATAYNAGAQVVDSAGNIISNVGSSMQPAMAQAGHIAGQVGSQVGQAAGQVGEALAPAAAQVGAVAGEVGAQVAEVGAEVVAASSEALSNVASEIAETAPEFLAAASFAFESGSAYVVENLEAIDMKGIVDSVPDVDFSFVGDAYDMASDSLAAIAGTVKSFFDDLITIEIIRDAFQYLSLLLGGAAVASINWMKNLFSLIAFNMVAIFKSINAINYFYIFMILYLIVFIWAAIARQDDPDEMRDGHELVEWEQRSKGSRKMISILFFILTSLYLTVTDNGINMLMCQEKYKLLITGQTCYEDTHLKVHIPAACISLIAFTIGFPVYLRKVIRFNMPKMMDYDDVGELKPFMVKANRQGDTEMAEKCRVQFRQYWHELCRQNKSPYKSLFNGLEFEYATFKVYVMMIKFALLIPMLTLTNEGTSLVRGLIMIAILLTYAIISGISSPFVKDENDRVDLFARIMALSTAVITLLLSKEILDDHLAGQLLNAINIVGICLMIFYTIMGLDCMKKKMRKCRMAFEFTDDCRYRLSRERKLRIWMPFWESVFNADPRYKPCADRLRAMKKVVSRLGRERYKQGLIAPPIQVQQARYYIETQLEGLDAFWDGVPKDGHLDDRTCFGKLWIRPFPFTAVFVWDGSGSEDDDYVEIWRDHELIDLATKNQHPEILRRRNVRWQLRALDGQRCRFEHDEWITKSYTTGSGENRRTQTVSVHFFFHSGVLHVKRNRSSEWSAGFKVSLHLDDGRGSARGRTWNNEHLTLNASRIGITESFEFTHTLSRLLFEPNNAQMVRVRYPMVVQKMQEYRNGLIMKRRQDEATLSWKFWYYVYYNDTLNVNGLHQYLVNCEMNPAMQQFTNVHQGGLRFLFARMGYVFKHPAICYWFVFWHDLWDNNGFIMGDDQKVKELFNTQYSSAIAYHICTREKLESLIGDLPFYDKLSNYIDLLYNVFADVMAHPQKYPVV